MATSLPPGTKKPSISKRGFGGTSDQNEMNFSKCKVGKRGVPLQRGKHLAPAVADFIKSCIIHTPKKLSMGRAVFYK